MSTLNADADVVGFCAGLGLRVNRGRIFTVLFTHFLYLRLENGKRALRSDVSVYASGTADCEIEGPCAWPPRILEKLQGILSLPRMESDRQTNY
jgi:hypothetical protein